MSREFILIRMNLQIQKINLIMILLLIVFTTKTFAQTSTNIKWLSNKKFEFVGASTVLLAFNSSGNGGVYTLKSSLGNIDCPFSCTIDQTINNGIKLKFMCEDEEPSYEKLKINEQGEKLESNYSQGGKKMNYILIK